MALTLADQILAPTPETILEAEALEVPTSVAEMPVEDRTVLDKVRERILAEVLLAEIRPVETIIACRTLLLLVVLHKEVSSLDRVLVLRAALDKVEVPEEPVQVALELQQVQLPVRTPVDRVL